jgi:hypothetical protein
VSEFFTLAARQPAFIELKHFGTFLARCLTNLIGSIIMTRIFALRAALLGAVLAASPAAAVNLIANGGFENTGFGGTGSYYNVGTTGADNPVPGDFGFAVPINNVDIIANGVFTSSLSGGGAYNLDLVGYGSTGSISQSFATILGKTYKVSVAYTQNGGGKTADVNVDGSAIGTLVGSGSWQTFTTTFIGTGASTTFDITEVNGGGNGGIVLDNISVSQVPEPAAWAMMLTGFGMLGFAMRRRQQTVAA